MSIYTDTVAYALHQDRATTLQQEAAASRLARAVAKGKKSRRGRRRAPSVPRQRTANEATGADVHTTPAPSH